MLGVALGVVLMPQLAGARPQGRRRAIRHAGLGPAPGGAAVGALRAGAAGVRAPAGRGAVPQRRVQATATCADRAALMGYGAGLVGLVAIKVLAPGYYAKPGHAHADADRIGVLVLTQLLNVVAGALLQHAGLALSISLGALVNAGWLLGGPDRARQLPPTPGWGNSCCRCWSPPRCSACCWCGRRPFRLDRPAAHRLQRVGLLRAVPGRRRAALFRGACARRREAAQFVAVARGLPRLDDLAAPLQRHMLCFSTPTPLEYFRIARARATSSSRCSRRQPAWPRTNTPTSTSSRCWATWISCRTPQAPLARRCGAVAPAALAQPVLLP